MNDAGPRVGVLLPTREVELGTGVRLGDVLDLAVAAEEAGLDSVWVGDSPLARPRGEPFTLLGAIAARTHTVGLGTAALLAALRPALHTAHAAATLDQLAPGRVTLGVGAGFPVDATRDELAAFGVPFAGRARRLDRIVALWRAVWSGDAETAAAAARALDVEASAATLSALPRPATAGGPDVWLAAGASPAVTTRVAHHYDGWLPYLPTPTAYTTAATAITTARPSPATPPRPPSNPRPDRPSPTALRPPTGRASPVTEPQAESSSALAARSAAEDSLVVDTAADLSRPVFGLYVTLTLAEDETPAAIARAREGHEAYLRAYYGVGADVIGSFQACHVGDPASAVELLGRYVAAGARHFVVRLAATGSDHRRQLGLLADEVAPSLRRRALLGTGHLAPARCPVPRTDRVGGGEGR